MKLGNREISKRGFRTEAEAKRASKHFKADLNRNRNLLKSEKTVDDFLFDYYENKKNFIQGRTIKNYLRNYQIVNDYFGKTKMKNVTNYMYQNFLDCYSKGRAKGTVKKMYTQVRTVFKYAHANGITAIDPTYDIYLPFENKAKDRNLMYLHEHELKKLLEVLNESLEEYSPSL